MPAAITIDELVIGDEPDSWRRAGFTVDDDGIALVGQVRLALRGRDEGKRIRSWSLAGLPPQLDPVSTDSIDGIPTVGATRRAPTEQPSPTPSPHPNGVVVIDHLVLVTPDQARTTAVFEQLGLRLLRERHTDTYGAPFLQHFFRAGEVLLELIGPEEPSGDGPAGFFGLAYTVADLDATAAFLGEDGVSAPKAAVQPGRRICTLRHRHFDLSVATAFMSADRDRPDTSGADAR
jgi:catechol 2,3-dioxygenase-like lactoylglutathione lyase family enzyme